MEINLMEISIPLKPGFNKILSFFCFLIQKKIKKKKKNTTDFIPYDDGSNITLHCITVLYCIALHCRQHCIAFYCIALYCIVLCIALHTD
jgi:hypothetical protein